MKFNIVTIVKDEGPYIQEFLEYHLLQGVDHFYIYDNDSTDNTQEILLNYSKLGILTYKLWPKFPPPTSTQLMMYRDFLQNNQKMEELCAFIDADEFLYTEDGTVKEWLEDFLRVSEQFDFGHLGGIVVPWILFGSSGHETYEEGLVIERFTRRSSHLDKHVKSILFPSRVQAIGNDAHSFRMIEPLANVWGERVSGLTPCFPENEAKDFEGVLRINHFHVKSKEEYRARCARGRIDVEQKRDFEVNFPIHDCNEVEDTDMLWYSEDIIKAIKSRPWNKK